MGVPTAPGSKLEGEDMEGGWGNRWCPAWPGLSGVGNGSSWGSEGGNQECGILETLRLRVWSLRDLGNWSEFGGSGISGLTLELYSDGDSDIRSQWDWDPKESRPRIRLLEGLASSALAVKGLVLCRGASSWGASPRGSGVSGSGFQTPYLLRSRWAWGSGVSPASL